MDWKEDFEEIAERQIFTIDGKKGTLKNTYIYESILSFIENILEQEKKRISDEIDELYPTMDSNEARRGYDQARADILFIINSK